MTSAVRAIVTKAAPSFSAVAYHKNAFRTISNTDYAGKYFCLFFYPLDFSFICPTEVLELSDQASEFEKNNCSLIGCSIDSQFSHMEWCKKPRNQGGLGELQFPLLSDITKQISRDYGSLCEEEGTSLRASYIVDGKGILRHLSINDFPVGRNISELLRLIQAFQYTDKHGEVCPVQWTPGSATLHADKFSQKNKEYWQTIHSTKGQ